jgi:hypothetical protein
MTLENNTQSKNFQVHASMIAKDSKEEEPSE